MNILREFAAFYVKAVLAGVGFGVGLAFSFWVYDLADKIRVWRK